MQLEQLKKVKYWGASTSAHQVEGKNHNQWTVWELENAAELAKRSEMKYKHWLPNWDEISRQALNPANYVSNIAVDHFSRFEEDFDLVKQLNLNAFRLSIEWSRIEPEKGQWDDEAIEHYRRVLQALRKRKIEPFVCLWHWTLPTWFTDLGGFEFRANIEYFIKFCEKIAVELGEYVTYIITLNEPNVYSGQSYVQDIWPPQARSTWRGLKVYKNLIKAHREAYTSLKSIRSKFKIGIAQNAEYDYTGDDSPISHWVARARHWAWNWYFFERTKEEHDFTGVNYYMSNRVVGLKTDNLDEKQSDLGWNMEPADLEHVIVAAYKRYSRPVIVTENGLADRRDLYRKWWLKETMGGISRAVNRGARVDGYLHWSLLDNFEWAEGFWPKFGLVEVDRNSMKRTIRPSALWWSKELAKIQKSK